MKLVIPCRKGSKGVPFKNRKLFPHTLSIIPVEYREHTIVTTDDEAIVKMCEGQGVKVIHRNEELSDDYASMKDVLLDVVKQCNLTKLEDIVLLYNTYPQRDWLDVISIYHHFIKNNFKSLLCQKEIVESHPYLMMYDLGNGRGKQLIKHDLYRRQDYPKVFEICHYVAIQKVSELKKLNKNLYNEDTYFYPIDINPIDVDLPEDIDRMNLV